MAQSIENLNIYKTARGLEDQIYELVKTFPVETFYNLGNDLRRSSAAVSHYISQSHSSFSYQLKLDALANARVEAERTKKFLEAASKYKAPTQLLEDYTGVIKQSWGLTRWLKLKQTEKAQTATALGKDELVAARS